MKNILLAFATATLMAAPAVAQNYAGNKLHNTNVFTFKPTHALTLNKQQAKLNLPISNHIKPMIDVNTGATERNSKHLSYEVTGSELNGDWGLVPTGIDYKALNQHNISIGYAQTFNRAVLDRFVGNKVGKIKFCPWMGSFTDGKLFIADMNAYDATTGKFTSYLWQKDITIKGSTTKNININTVDCDYTIPAQGLENGIIIGFHAKVKAAANDPYAAQYGYIVTAYSDQTQAGAGGLIWLHENETGIDYPAGSISNSGLATALWAETEGTAGLRAEDACAATVDAARGPIGSTQSAKAQFINFGTDSIYSVNYTFENDGKKTEGMARFREPIYYHSIGSFNLDFPVNATPGRHQSGKLTITKVNGKDDEYTDLQDNEVPNATAIAFDKGYKRTPVIEEFTSTTCGYCPFGIVGVPNAVNAVKGKAVAITVHTDFNPNIGHDPLVTDTYAPIAQAYIYQYPSALINREGSTHAYYDIVDAVKAMAEKPCEASITLTPKRSLKGVKFDTKLNFTIDAPAQSYALAYVITEDKVEAVSQLNNLAAIYNELTKKGDPSGVQFYNNLPNDCKPLATGDFFRTEAGKDDKGNTVYDYWTNFDMDYVACTLVDPYNATDESDLNKLVLPAITAGQEISHSYTMNNPSRVVQNDPQTGRPYVYTSDVPAINANNLSYAALLIDLTSGKIVTGCQAKMGETVSSNEVADLTGINAVVANNAADVADITVANGAFNVKANGAVAKVYDAQGRLVSSATVNGEASLPTFGKGVFVIRVVKGGNVATQKAIF